MVDIYTAFSCWNSRIYAGFRAHPGPMHAAAGCCGMFIFPLSKWTHQYIAGITHSHTIYKNMCIHLQFNKKVNSNGYIEKKCARGRLSASGDRPLRRRSTWKTGRPIQEITQLHASWCSKEAASKAWVGGRKIDAELINIRHLEPVFPGARMFNKTDRCFAIFMEWSTSNSRTRLGGDTDQRSTELPAKKKAKNRLYRSCSSPDVLQ